MADLLALLRSEGRLDAPSVRAELEQLGTPLAVGRGHARADKKSVTEAVDFAQARRVEDEGFGALRGLVSADTAEPIASAIASLRDANLPATFVYFFDEPWQLGETVRSRVSAVLGTRYETVTDFWAWHIAPGEGRGWPPHRGVTSPLSRSLPELVNTWIALSDVEADRACMHFVPLDDDPHYPHALDRTQASPELVRVAPLACGDALAWNANVLHWGGTCSRWARAPRVSASFSLARGDVASRWPLGRACAVDLRLRLEAVASQIVTYGQGQPDVSQAVLEWAHATLTMSHVMAKLGSQRGAP